MPIVSYRDLIDAIRANNYLVTTLALLKDDKEYITQKELMELCLAFKNNSFILEFSIDDLIKNDPFVSKNHSNFLRTCLERNKILAKKTYLFIKILSKGVHYGDEALGYLPRKIYNHYFERWSRNNPSVNDESKYTLSDPLTAHNDSHSPLKFLVLAFFVRLISDFGRFIGLLLALSVSLLISPLLFVITAIELLRNFFKDRKVLFQFAITINFLAQLLDIKHESQFKIFCRWLGQTTLQHDFFKHLISFIISFSFTWGFGYLLITGMFDGLSIAFTPFVGLIMYNLVMYLLKNVLNIYAAKQALNIIKTRPGNEGTNLSEEKEVDGILFVTKSLALVDIFIDLSSPYKELSKQTLKAKMVRIFLSNHRSSKFDILRFLSYLDDQEIDSITFVYHKDEQQDKNDMPPWIAQKIQGLKHIKKIYIDDRLVTDQSRINEENKKRPNPIRLSNLHGDYTKYRVRLERNQTDHVIKDILTNPKEEELKNFNLMYSDWRLKNLFDELFFEHNKNTKSKTLMLSFFKPKTMSDKILSLIRLGPEPSNEKAVNTLFKGLSQMKSAKQARSYLKDKIVQHKPTTTIEGMVL